MIDLSLHGRTVLITGSTQGVGAAIALGAARAGANLVLHGLQDDPSAQATLQQCRQCGVTVELVFQDLSQPAPAVVESLIRQVDSTGLRVDTLVNNAGTYRDIPFLDMEFEAFQQTMALNVFAPFFLTQAFARRWVADTVAGRVLMIGSINGQLAEPTHAAYDTSKGAVAMMVKTLCVELAPLGIRVNGLAPGLFETPLTHAALADPAVRSWMELHTPNGFVPGPEVAAETAVFLISDAARHIQGQMLMVDGGMSAWQQPDPPTGWTGK